MKKILCTIFFIILSITLNAQDITKTNPDKSFSKNSDWFFEGSVAFTVGTQSYVGVTPLIGYKITPNFHSGATLSYFHFWDNTYDNNPRESNVFGGSIVFRWLPVKEFFLSFEPAVYSYKVYSDATTYENKAVTFLFIGAGYNYYLNPNMFLTFQTKIDLLGDSGSPYANSWYPFFNAGIGFSL